MSGRRRSISGIEGRSPSFKPPRYRYSGSAPRSSKKPETRTPSPSVSFSETFRIYLRLSMNSRKPYDKSPHPPFNPTSPPFNKGGMGGFSWGRGRICIKLPMRDSSFKNSETCSLASVSASASEKSSSERSLLRVSAICLKVPLSFRDSRGLSFLKSHLNSFSISGRISFKAGLLTFANVFDKPSHEFLPLIIPE